MIDASARIMAPRWFAMWRPPTPHLDKAPPCLAVRHIAATDPKSLYTEHYALRVVGGASLHSVMEA